MSRQKNIEIETNLRILPAIRKSGSSSTSSPLEIFKPKIVLTSPIHECSELSENGSNKAPDELLIKRIETFSTPKDIKSIFSKAGTERLMKRLHDLESTNKSLEEEIKVLKSHEEIKHSREFMFETISSVNKKNKNFKTEDKSNSDEFVRQNSKRTKYKEIELLDTKKKNEDFQGQVESLRREILELKIKNQILKGNIEKNKESLIENESLIKEYQNSIKSIEIKFAEKEAELKFKQAELNEVSEMLKKSEEKRKSMIDYHNSVESTMLNFQKKLNLFQKSNADQQKEIQEMGKLVKNKEEIIDDLNQKIYNLEALLDSETEKFRKNNKEFEKTRENFESLLEQSQVKLEKMENEKNKLQENITRLQSDAKFSVPIINFGKKIDSNLDSKLISDISKEEAIRWHSRCIQSEKELSDIKQLFEKNKKDYEYTKQKLTQKQTFIEQLENFIKKSTSENTIESPHENYLDLNISEIAITVDLISEATKEIENQIKCVGCFQKNENYFVCYPCLHICCNVCKHKIEDLCPNCAEKVSDIVHFKLLDNISEYLADNAEKLKRLKTLINYENLN